MCYTNQSRGTNKHIGLVENMDNLQVLMLSKKRNSFCDYAEAILKSYFKADEFLSVRGNVGDDFDTELCWYNPSYILSFVSPWIIPQGLLDRAQKAAINFHPGSPDYPGTGCYNFALYEGAERYGVTVHHMERKVDTGNIIMTSYFDVSPHESVETLKLKSMCHLLFCFEKIVHQISKDEPLPVSDETWRRKPFTRKEMHKLFEIDLIEHDKEEVERRIRAAEYPGVTGAFIMANGHKFYVPYEERKPIVD